MKKKMGSLFQKIIELHHKSSRFQNHNLKNPDQMINVKAFELQEIFRKASEFQGINSSLSTDENERNSLY